MLGTQAPSCDDEGAIRRLLRVGIVADQRFDVRKIVVREPHIGGLLPEEFLLDASRLAEGRERFLVVTSRDQSNADVIETPCDRHGVLSQFPLKDRKRSTQERVL